MAEFYDKESGIALFVGNGGNVGIGIVTPQQQLDVSGNITCSGYMFYPNSIIQTVLMRYTPASHISTTSTSFVDAAETISITPKFSNSKIRIEFNSEMAHINSGSGVMYGNLQRKIGSGSYTTITGGSYNWFYRDGYFWAPMTNVMIDTPNTTEIVTYKGQIKVNNSAYTGYWVHGNQGYCWTLQEIKQ